MPAKQHLVYVVQQGQTGPVKIGHTSNLALRLRNLQGGSADKLLVRREIVCGSIHHAREVERHLHSQYADHRMSGEWFSVGVLLTLESVDIPAYSHQGPRHRNRNRNRVPMFSAVRSFGGPHVYNANKVPAPKRATSVSYYDDRTGSWKTMAV